MTIVIINKSFLFSLLPAGEPSSDTTSTATWDETQWRVAADLAAGGAWQQLLASSHHGNLSYQRFAAAGTTVPGPSATASVAGREDVSITLQALHSGKMAKV